MGTACSILLSEHDDVRPTLWVRDSGQAADLAACRENRRHLPGIPLPKSIRVTDRLDEALAGAELLVLAIPTAHLRSSLTAMTAQVPAGIPVVSVIKGLEVGTFLRPSEIIREVLGPRSVVALCGPSHAEEIGRRLPASVVAAGTDAELARRVQLLFTTERFRVYTNPDILGVELAAALKNVMAIAAGICDGLRYGDNAKAALLTRGIVEMTRFGVTLGADPETFAGLAGIGDLITTCFSGFGRNRRVGERLGQGISLPQILSEMTGVAEGVPTCRSVHELTQRRGIEMPITGEVYQVLFAGKSAEEATNSLMMRPLRAELREG